MQRIDAQIRNLRNIDEAVASAASVLEFSARMKRMLVRHNVQIITLCTALRKTWSPQKLYINVVESGTSSGPTNLSRHWSSYTVKSDSTHSKLDMKPIGVNALINPLHDGN
jgi:hypothetical protein